MSKMGDINLQLEEQAVERGFESVEAMEQAGYKWRIEKVDGDDIAMWYKPEDDIEEAHRAWLQEKHEIIDDLEWLNKDIWEDDLEQRHIVVKRAIKFLKGVDL